MANLAKVGIPVHIVDDADCHSHVSGGVVLYISEPPGKELLLSWYMPNEEKYSGREVQDRPEAMGAIATLTTTVVSILAAFNHQVRTEYGDCDFPSCSSTYGLTSGTGRAEAGHDRGPG
jgi:hypothetical protein